MMTEPFDSFDEFDEPIRVAPQQAKTVVNITVNNLEGDPDVPPVPVPEEPVAKPKKTRGRKKVEVVEPVEIPANVPALEE